MHLNVGGNTGFEINWFRICPRNEGFHCNLCQKALRSSIAEMSHIQVFPACFINGAPLAES